MFASRIVVICILAISWSAAIADEAEDRTREGFQALVDGDQEKFFEHALKDAEEGLPEAQLMVGAAYERGVLGAPKNLDEALKWYRRAADQNMAEAEIKIANFYLTGTGVPRDLKMANEWLLRASDHGSAKADNFLGDSYLTGRGVEKNADTAARYYLKAANANIANSQITIGGLYVQGLGVPKDIDEGYFWLLVAQGNSNPAKIGGLGQAIATLETRIDPKRRQEIEIRAREFIAAQSPPASRR